VKYGGGRYITLHDQIPGLSVNAKDEEMMECIASISYVHLVRPVRRKFSSINERRKNKQNAEQAGLNTELFSPVEG